MIIIGEKINGSIPSVAKAIAERNEDWIRNLAKIQAEQGANFIDVCASVKDNEVETLHWLIDLVQEVTDTPICVDSPDPEVCVAAMKFCKKPGMINSVSMEGNKCDVILPAIAGTDWQVVALTCDDDGIPNDPKVKYEIAKRIMAKVDEYGVDHDNILFDPLVTTLGTNQQSFLNFIEAVELIKADYPDVHFTSGLSNISYGLPYRKAINMQFLCLAMNAGMDSAIMDPTSPDMQATMHATAALLGQDEYCMDYLEAYRDGMFPVKPED